MNPYEAPGDARSDTPPPDSPEALPQRALLMTIGAGCTLVRWVLDILQVPLVAWWMPPLCGLIVGAVAARAVRLEPERFWMGWAIGVTVVAVSLSYVLPIPGGALHRDYAWPQVAALVIAARSVHRVVRGLDHEQATRARNAELRAKFAHRREPHVSVRRPSSEGARFACGACGELFAETDLTTLGGKRRCASCVE